MTETERLHDTVLELLIPDTARNPRAVVAGLSAADWTYIIARGREHRFLPLLSYSLDQTCAAAAVPKDAKGILSEVRRRHTLRALAAQRELLLVHRHLEEAGIRHVFLKGAFLAQFIYPHPSLRPVRDLDVVVPPTEALRAHKLMLAQGYRPLVAASAGVIDAHIDHAKHLPGLRSPSGTLTVELHVHIDRPGGVLSGMDPFQHVVTRALAGENLPFMDPDDLLVHLCVHAANFHNFNNGPLVIADIGFLLRSGEVNTARAAARAAALGVTKPVALTIALTESCWGSQAADSAQLFDPVSKDLLHTARQLCFQSFKDRSATNLAADLVSVKTGARLWAELVAKLFPSASSMALEFGKARNRLDLFRFLLKRWRRIMIERVPQIIGATAKPAFHDDYKRVKALKKWLE
jgi:hypothetical protein